MAKGFKHGAGGSNVLNFKVVGNPQPTNPRENTIWVNTDTPISGWSFSSIGNPTWSMEEGFVYIKAITADSNYSAWFNAYKKTAMKNYEIILSPISAKQYVGGAWQDKAAKIYQGGKWVDWWNGELYNAGNEYTFLTGGFVTSGTCTLEKQADRMKLTNNAVGGILTKNPIDLTEYKTVELKVIPYTNDGYCLIATKKATTTMYNDSSIAASKIGSTTNGVLATRTIDVSSLSGDYYIGVGRFDSYAISLDVISLKLIK